MPVIAVRIPQMGEGLQEARVVAFLKKPGDDVKRDDPLYQMETDKAVMDVESPYDGTLAEWTAEEGQVLPIGTEIARMEVADGVKEMAAGHGPPPKETERSAEPEPAQVGADGDGKIRNAQIPPRTRRYLKEKGLLELAAEIPAKGKKLMPEDVDIYLAGQDAPSPAVTVKAVSAPPKVLKTTTEFEETEVPSRQQTLSYRLARGAQLCVPGTIMLDACWDAIAGARESVKKSAEGFKPSAFTMFAWCVKNAMVRNPKFRSVLSSDGKSLRTYKGANLGIAVALPNDELVTAMVPNSDALSWEDFGDAARYQIQKARDGQDQATEATTLSITDMSRFGLLNAVPVVVSPSVATLFVGEAFWKPVPHLGGYDFKQTVTLSLTFDHRVINGVGAANFLNDVKSEIESFELPTG